tara:strand:- start:904 stop:1233 length:330 start_codon:yes stop_codon:yes gene_type:complete
MEKNQKRSNKQHYMVTVRRKFYMDQQIAIRVNSLPEVYDIVENDNPLSSQEVIDDYGDRLIMNESTPEIIVKYELTPDEYLSNTNYYDWVSVDSDSYREGNVSTSAYGK